MNNATPINNSENVALVWFDGATWRFHVYVPFAEHLTASGSAPSRREAMELAVQAAR